MIWHFFEVWLLLIVAFLIGCTIGALVYDIFARTRLVTGQGAVADSVGDVVDRIKDRLGVGPAWRPSRRRVAAWEAEGANRLHDEDGYQAAEDDGASGIAAAPADKETVRAEPMPAGPVGEPDPHAGEAGSTSIRPPDAATLSAVEPAARSVAVAAPPAATRRAEGPSTGAPDEIVPKRPATLAEPRNGVPDNLQRIRGIGERNEKRLNALGIFHFGQIAAWTPAEMRWVGQRLAFPERMERDDWIGQAIVLASGGDTGITKSAERRRMRRQQQRMSEPGYDEDEEDDEDYDYDYEDEP